MLRMFSFLLIVCCSLIAVDQQLTQKQIVIMRDIITRYKEDIVADKEIERLSRLDDKDFKHEFCTLHAKGKILYLLSLDIEHYERFLNRYKDEQEWSVFWNKLSTEEQQHIPETLQRQKKIIRNCYYNRCPATSWIPFCSQSKAPHIEEDLLFWKKQYYNKGISRVSNQYPFNAEILLNIDFLRRKYKMLHIYC